MSGETPRHTPFYCEENVWWLAQEPALAGRAREVVIITNAAREVVLFHQRAGSPVVWDYHVVLAVDRDAGEVEVWDLDCTLGAPLPASRWLAASFGGERGLPRRYHPRFRVVDADEWVGALRSDRAHMRDEHGEYLHPPPASPCIGEGESNLMRWVDLEDPIGGEVLDLAGLRARWGA